MRFGERLRELRKARHLGQKELAARVGLNHTYLSKIETESLDFGCFPSEETICKLAEALHAAQDELLLMADKIPPSIKRRLKERPDAFMKIAALDDEALNSLMAVIDKD
jgi:transcriptional regulator with XRE-family HTH domain